jgi:hypothetical protein
MLMFMDFQPKLKNKSVLLQRKINTKIQTFQEEL